MSMLLFDLNNLAFRTFFIKDVEITTPQPNFQFWKYIIVNSVYEAIYKVKDVKEIVLAVDDSKNWRTDYFPRYKESRKKQREKRTDIDWDTLFSVLHNYVLEIKEHLPFKVIQSPKSEADDIIAVLCMSDIVRDEKFIISNDEDFLQLCSRNVKLYNPSKQKYVECENTEKFIIEKSLLGQPKDDIFNVKTPSDWGQTPETIGKKKPGYGPAALKRTMEYGWKEWVVENKLENNYRRNRVLIDFRFIPRAIKGNIKKRYEKYELPEPDRIYRFFRSNNFRGFLEDFDKIERKLMELY